MSHSLSMATKGRMHTPESKVSKGVLYKGGVFEALKAIIGFTRAQVARVFWRTRVKQ